jgi:hypothetical protein
MILSVNLVCVMIFPRDRSNLDRLRALHPFPNCCLTNRGSCWSVLLLEILIRYKFYINEFLKKSPILFLE